ncbi:MAG: hypothetical protein D3910_10680 [Candidatus Electrothrix sp. ATG2]|nr:hypothetical protein [Candidatus Electrothrix sp. ATG2]
MKQTEPKSLSATAVATSYTTLIRQPVELTDQEQQAMIEQYLGHYDGSNEARFLADLQGKDEVLLILYNDTLVGFTTMQYYQQEWNGQQVRIVYSGDTVVERQHWGQQALSVRWIRRMGEVHRKNPALPLYWFLIKQTDLEEQIKKARSCRDRQKHKLIGGRP